jgi:hypothetical protein
MKPVFAVIIFVLLTSTTFAQSRSEALDKFNGLKQTVAALERIVLAPDKEDIEAAAKENVNVFRILPRETYDNSFSSIRGGGAYYSFYFRIPDYGYGSDIGLEQDYLSTRVSGGNGLMADLGEVPLREITLGNKAVHNLMNYQNVRYADSGRDTSLLGTVGLKLDQTTFKYRLEPIVGHTYLVRSMSYGYYDVLVAFRLYRKDTDGSFVIFWKMLEQFDTPSRDNAARVRVADTEILNRTKDLRSRDLFSGVHVDVNEGVATLRGTIAGKNLPYLVQLVNSAGAAKVVNSLDLK